MVYSHRRQKATDLLAKLELDALVFCQPENIRYLCGFTGSDGALILFSDHLVFFLKPIRFLNSKCSRPEHPVIWLAGKAQTVVGCSCGD